MLSLSSDRVLLCHHRAQAASILFRELSWEDSSLFGMHSQEKHFDLNEQF